MARKASCESYFCFHVFPTLYLVSSIMPAPAIPSPGQIVHCRLRNWLVQGVEARAGGHHRHQVSMVCVDDDAQGQPLECIWELELGRRVLDQEAWKSLGKRGFDAPRHFSAYLHTLRWNCITATDPSLFQSPFRAGIRIDAYQLEPLRKALRMPRVNLFIADDVGLGKTIEAGLVASELLLRRRVKDIVVSCPPSMLQQWQEELEQRFGLIFEIYDRAYVERIRQQRGYGVNPWKTYPRFLISHKLLIDESYTAPLRDHLDNLRPGSLLILDEAHHVAPASGSRYAIDSKITRAIRDLASRFEHRLFLSATPHNGHSNSFSALLELLDPQRFTRGVPVHKPHLADVMVRRLKEDIRQMAGGFPERKVVQIDLGGLPEDAPEIALSRLLEKYRDVRERRLEGLSKRMQNQSRLLITGLQQRLLSSVEAFARTLSVHRATMEKYWAAEKKLTPLATDSKRLTDALDLLSTSPDPEDDHAQLSDEDREKLEDDAISIATAATQGNAALADLATERRLLDEMATVAGSSRHLPDSRVRWLVQWIKENLCPGAAIPGEARATPEAPWTDCRVIIFTEYGDTRRYLQKMIEAAIAGTQHASHRLAVFHGPTPPDQRMLIKRAFNLPPAEHPVRILLATDAAREGLNFQAHCHHLFHFDIPWNPSRLEQRNGRIDRKLQPQPTVYCHYFVYPQRPEDRVLRALVRKAGTIELELGSMTQVLSRKLVSGIRHAEAASLAQEIEDATDTEAAAIRKQELESIRERQDELKKQTDFLDRRIKDARRSISLSDDHFRDALSCSLEMAAMAPLQPAATPAGHPERFTFPNLALLRGGEASWGETLDTLRKPPENGIADARWRKDAPLRPVTFASPDTVDDDSVQLHLEHRVVRRLLGRFTSQGFVYHDLSRACLAQGKDSVVRVVLLGRLSVYGPQAARLHEEILTVSAAWSPLASRKGPLTPYARTAESRTLEMLEEGLAPQAAGSVPTTAQEQLTASLAEDIAQLLPHLETRGQAAREDAEKKLAERGRVEADGMRKILEDQKKRVMDESGESESTPMLPGLQLDEQRQLESNRRYWKRWLENVENDLRVEPERILQFYKTQSARIEPIGIAYLWPVG